MNNLNGKVSNVTCGASGIGLATVKAFVDEGVKVVIVDYIEEAGKDVEKELLAEGTDVLFLKVNVADEKAVENMVIETVEKYGKVDVLVNNAGIGVLTETHELSFEDYNKVISINQNGIFFGAKGAVNIMTKSLALEYAEKNIRVNTVCPGYVESGTVNKGAFGDY